MPRTTDMVASVAIKGCNLRKVTSPALTAPTRKPAQTAIASARIAGTPSRARIAASTPAQAATEPADRSFWLAIIRFVSPIATNPVREQAIRILIMFAPVT